MQAIPPNVGNTSTIYIPKHFSAGQLQQPKRMPDPLWARGEPIWEQTYCFGAPGTSCVETQDMWGLEFEDLVDLEGLC